MLPPHPACRSLWVGSVIRYDGAGAALSPRTVCLVGMTWRAQGATRAAGFECGFPRWSTVEATVAGNSGPGDVGALKFALPRSRLRVGSAFQSLPSSAITSLSGPVGT